jgi:mRNA interferase MazF
MDLEYKRGDVWIGDLSGAVGNEQHGVRPLLIVSNDRGNKFSPNVTVAVMSSSTTKSKLPTHVFIKARDGGMELDSVVMTESLRTIDKWNLMNKVATLTEEEMKQVNFAIDVSLDRVKDRK